jgi:hypothetical protein
MADVYTKLKRFVITKWHQTAVLPLRLRTQAGWAYTSKSQTAAGDAA